MIGTKVVPCEKPLLLAGDTILLTGQISRTTPFEKEGSNRFIEKDGGLELGAILDDQALVVNLKGKGLVVISSCAHA